MPSQTAPLVTRPPVEILGRYPGYGFAGLSVSTAIGNFTQTTFDLRFPSALLGLLDWQRTYNSHSGAIGALGPGWSTSFSASLVASAPSGLLHQTPGPVTFNDEDGRVLTFTPEASGGFTRPQDLNASLLRNADGTFTVTYNSGEVWSFDTTGRLTERSREGQQVTLSYDGQDLLLRAAHSSGRHLTFAYDANRRLTRVAAADGRTVSFTYGAGTVTDALLETVTVPGGGECSLQYSGTGQASQISRITDPDGNLVVANTYDTSTSAVTSQEFAGGGGAGFAYDTATGTTTVTATPSGARFVFDADANGRLAKLTTPDGHSATFSYDSNGYLATATTPAGTTLSQTHDDDGNLLTSDFGESLTSWAHDSLGRITSVTAPDGGVTSYSYSGGTHIPAQVTDASGGVTLITSASGLITARTDQDGNTTAYGYDALSNLTSITRPSGGVMTMTHDAAGNTTGLTSASGAASQWAYSGTGQVTSYTGPDGAVTQFSYSPAGLLLQQSGPGATSVTYGYDSAGNQTTVADALENQTTFGYDQFGNLTSVTDAVGGVTQYGYDDLGQLVSITEPEGAVTRFGYDADSNNISQEGPAGTVTASYDARGNNVSVTDATGATIKYGYDAMDRLTSLTDPLNGSWQLGYDALGNVLSVRDPSGASAGLGWTAAGRLASTTDPLGRQGTYAHDADGRVTEATDAQGGAMRYIYDQDGRRVSVTSPAGLVTRFQYDSAGRVVATTDPRGWITRTEYDVRGQRVAMITPGGTVTRYGYNAAGQLTEQADGNGSVTRYGYDAAGRLISVTGPKGAVTTYGYDQAGRLTSETDPLDRTTQRAYDQAGNLITITDPSGHEQHMTYDADGQLTQWNADDTVMVSFSYDSAGHRTSLTDATGTTHYAYDSVGNLLSTTGPDGEAVTAAYDAAGQRTSLSYPGGLTVGYSYDLNGRLIGLTDTRAGTAAYALDPDGLLLTEQLPGRLARRYHYSGGLLERFTAIRDGHPEVSASFTRDPDGRILSQREGGDVREFRYDRAGQLVYAGRPDDEVHLVYDVAGNRVSMRHRNVEMRYAYDAADQLTALDAQGRRTEFRYDSSGRLTAQTEGERSLVTRYNGFGWPVEVTRTSPGEREIITTTFDGDGLAASVVLTAVAGTAEERAAQVRYRWSTGDQIPQILTQRASPDLDEAERDRPGRLDADFAYGYGRTFASSPHAAAVFAHDAYASAVRTDDTADWVQARAYDAFGTPVHAGQERAAGHERAERGPHAPELPRFGYRGELALGSLIDLRARVYANDLGRFTSPEPVLSNSPTPGQDANPYLYAGNDPLNFTDPLGTFLVAPLGGGAVTSKLPPTPDPPAHTAVLTSALSSQALSVGGDRSSVHNVCTVAGALVLAAQLAAQYGIPANVQFEMRIPGAPKKLMNRYPPTIPSKSQSYGKADLAITYAAIGFGNYSRVYIWETKSVISPSVLSAQATLANQEATWYSAVFNQRSSEMYRAKLAQPGPPMAIPALLSLPRGFPGASSTVYEVFSKPPGLFGAILYRSTNWRVPPGIPVYRYQPEPKTLRQVRGPHPSPIGINAQRLVLGAAIAVLLAGTGAAAYAAVPSIIVVLQELAEALGPLLAGG